MARISCVINTFNEEDNVATAIKSVSAWVDEVVVVDMHSGDRTREIAEALGARVYLYDYLGYADPARGFAIRQTTNDWVLILDADELVTPRLAERLMQLAREDRYDIVWVPRENYLFGHRYRGGGWGGEQDTHKRFFKKGSLLLQGDLDVHTFFKETPGARVGHLSYEPEACIVHFNYVNSKHWFEKMNRYTTIQAQHKFDRGERYHPTLLRCIGGLAVGMFERFARNKGYRDGWHGVVLTMYMAIYDFLLHIKLWELSEGRTWENVVDLYGEIATSALNGLADDMLESSSSASAAKSGNSSASGI